MNQIIRLSLFIFTLILSKSIYSQIVWQETFDTPDKGYWADSTGQIHVDLSDVSWTLDVTGCVFSNENDYAKTVTTSEGRFEVLDSDGEVIWTSYSIQIAAYDAINISFESIETGSSSAPDKKYIKAFYKIDNDSLHPFLPDSVASGNWGNKKFVQKAIRGELLQIIIKMNSSYASDKIILDNIIVEAIDSSSLVPSQIRMIESPFLAFIEDTLTIAASVYNANNEQINDSSIILNLNSDNLTVVSQLYKNGIYQWNLLAKTTGTFPFSIKDKNETLAAFDSSIIYFSYNDLIVNEGFEGETFRGWDIKGQWEVSTIEPIAGLKSIKHLTQNTNGKGELVYSGEAFNLNEEIYLFSFKLKNGDWDPSSSNSFYLWLVQQDEINTDGYAIGVDADGTSDLVSIWKVRQGIPDELLAETRFDWNTKNTVQINVVRSALGAWVLNATDLQTGLSFSTSTYDVEFTQINQLRLIFNYTASRSGELWFDDLLVCGQNAPPYLAGAKPIAENQIQLTFNEAVRANLLTPDNFTLSASSGKIFNILSIAPEKPNTLLLNTNTLNEPFLSITARSFSDLDGNVTLLDKIDFENTLAPANHDLIISEIMADPNPPVSLPDAEYIELYNQSNKYIQLNGIGLFVRNTNYPIPPKLIYPGEYVILCDENFDSVFSTFGKVVAFPKFPSLLNTGAYLNLNTTEGLIIDELSYSDNWYYDPAKDNGGYSLERIDLTRFCGQQANWSASVDPKGGTPGKLNSINAENKDEDPPILLAIDIVNYTEITIFFNEQLDTLLAQQSSNYAVPGLNISSAKYIDTEMAVNLLFSSPLKVKTEYTLEVREISDECGNTGSGDQLSFAIAAITKGDIVINEVLYNPYTGGADFVELYNKSGVTVDFTDLKIATRDDSLRLKSVYEISNWHKSFKNHSYIALSKDTANIKQNYYVPYPENLLEMEKFPAYNNDEGRVVLLNDSLQIIDEFSYNENMQSEWLNQLDGVSLERISVDDSTNDVLNWHSASTLVGYATPGYTNSLNKIEEKAQIQIELVSNVVSPNGDGFNDELEITFMVDDPDYLANVYIFNANGYEVKRLMNNDLIGNGNKINYDLRGPNGDLLPMGTYLLLTELIHQNTKTKVLKTAFHVTDKR